MPRPRAVPEALKLGPFTLETAARYGVTRRMLGGPNYAQLFRGVYIFCGLRLTQARWLAAALLTLPADATASHVTALWLYGVEIGPAWPLQFSTNTTSVCESSRICLHRRRGRLYAQEFQGLPVLGPDRTFVDAATQLTFVQRVQAAEMLLHQRRTTLEDLWEFALT